MKRLLLCSLFLSGCLSFHPAPLPNAPQSATFTEVGDTHVRYLDLSPKAAAQSQTPPKTVVLVHGFGASIEEWALLIPKLVQNNYRVLAMDLKGHGWSSRPEGDYSISAQANLVLNLADQRKIDKFYVVGHSWGSSIAMAIGIMAPTRVPRIAIYNGMLYQEQQPLLFSWARVPVLGEYIYGVVYPQRSDEKFAFTLYDKSLITEEMVEGLDRVMERPGTLAAALAGVRQMHQAELQKQYPKVQQPVLMMWGRDDEVTPLPWGEKLLRELPHGRLVVYPQCGHVPMWEAAGASSDELLRFFAEDKP